MLSSSQSQSSLQDLENLCVTLSSILEREHSVLRKSNGLIGHGVGELEALHSEKESEIGRLEMISRAEDAIAAARAQPDVAQRVREQLTRCKQLQARNHQVFSRIVSAQRRIISVLRETDDDISLYDRGGRTRDYGVTHRAGTA